MGAPLFCGYVQDIISVLDWITKTGAIGAIGVWAQSTEIVDEYSLNPNEL